MDLSTIIVDLLRGDENAKLDPSSVAAYARPSKPSALEEGGRALAHPGYAAYKREALANGEPVMSPEEFSRAQSEGR